jgi:dihydroxyacetone kinase-like protein
MNFRISSAQMMQVVEKISDTMEQEKGYLSELDGVIGDGDHGVNMAKCFREVRKKLPESQGKDIGALLRNVGMVVLNSVGGAMGALYGTFFLRMAQEAAGKNEIDLADLVKMLKAGEKGIREIGKGDVGDKTLLDTLVPAVSALEKAHQEGKPLPDALAAFDAAAKNGMESTKGMIARVGRASRLGERTIGHQDAGATSCYFILHAFCQVLCTPTA